MLTSEASRQRVAELTYDNFMRSFGCSQSILQAFQDVLDFEDSFWFKAVGALQGGGFSSLTCGGLATGLLLIGGRVGRDSLEQGIQGMPPAFEPCQRLTSWFKPTYKSTVCSEIAGVDWFNMSEVADHFLGPKASEAHEKCARLASGAAYKIAKTLSQLQSSITPEGRVCPAPHWARGPAPKQGDVRIAHLTLPSSEDRAWSRSSS